MRNGHLYALLVEDEPLVAMLAAEVLGDMGFEVAEAASAEQAVKLAAADIRDFDLAVVDLGLPDREGGEVVAELKTMRSDLPIIVASGRAVAASSVEFSRCEKLAVLTKPYLASSLRSAVQSLGISIVAGLDTTTSARPD
jgi:DNA-binding response OmpR family regulator